MKKLNKLHHGYHKLKDCNLSHQLELVHIIYKRNKKMSMSTPQFFKCDFSSSKNIVQLQ